MGADGVQGKPCSGCVRAKLPVLKSGQDRELFRPLLVTVSQGDVLTTDSQANKHKQAK